MADATKSTAPKLRVVCILGMHRSGTSMITRVINLMGVYLGETENMLPASEYENAEGFWEHIEIINIHEAILNELNSSWESTKPLPDKWWELPNIKQYRNKLIELIKFEFSNVPLWGFKDPRTCIMLPLWKEVFEIINIEPMFIIPLRTPIDIAHSLMKRNNFSLNHSMRLWYYYMINILEETQSYKRIFIQYDDMMENADLNIMKLIDFLSIKVSSENKKCIKKSLKPNLRHSKTNQSDLELLESKQVVELYNICIKLIDNPYNQGDLKLHSSKIYKLYSDFMEVQYADKKSESYITSLFMDYGSGYGEEDSIKQRVIMNENNEFNIHFDIEQNGENIKNLRWDPLEGTFCKCIIDNIMINNIPIKIEDSNADYSDGKESDFLNIDPMYFLENHYKVVDTVSIRGKFQFYEPFQLQMFLQKKKENITKIDEKLRYYENENSLLIKDRDQIINAKDSLIKEKDRIIFEDENQHKILLNEKVRLDEEIYKILNSLSWRITKPLRSIKHVVLGVINKLV